MSKLVNTEKAAALLDMDEEPFRRIVKSSKNPPPQGCSTLSTKAPLEECVDTAESGGIAILIEC